MPAKPTAKTIATLSKNYYTVLMASGPNVLVCVERCACGSPSPS